MEDKEGRTGEETRRGEERERRKRGTIITEKHLFSLGFANIDSN